MNKRLNSKAVIALAKWTKQNAKNGSGYFAVSTAFELFGKNCFTEFTPLPNRVKALFRQLKRR